MLFFQLNHFQPTAVGQNANLACKDYKFIHVPRKGSEAVNEENASFCPKNCPKCWTHLKNIQKKK